MSEYLGGRPIQSNRGRTGIGVSDHALLRFLERAAGLDIEALRDSLNASLARAHATARSLGDSDYLIRADGLIYVVRGDTVTTVLEDEGEPIAHAYTLERGFSRARPTQSNRGRV